MEKLIFNWSVTYITVLLMTIVTCIVFYNLHPVLASSLTLAYVGVGITYLVIRTLKS